METLARLQAWHIRDETYAAALAELVNAQHDEPFAAHWEDGTTSSSDGQRFRAGGRAETTGHVNLKYGTEPGRMIYTHISDKYAPFHTKVVNVGVRDSTHVLDGLFYHEADIGIEENPDLRRRSTAGFNKGEARHALAKVVFFNRLGELRDRTLDQQRYRASGLNLVTAAIVLWNTVYPERATNAHQAIEADLLQHLSPLGWAHINLTGDYTWKTRHHPKSSKYRPLRPLPNP